MQRKIKFRAWDGYHHEMVYPEMSEDMTDKVTSASLLAAYNDGGMESLMQYTGLADKNGKEIYEGDIVKYPAQKGETIGIIDFIYNSYMVKVHHHGHDTWVNISKDSEVIGNIYENPDLL